ncbi:transcriptional regulator, LacI family [Paenibacillus sp. UNC496MF]|nr:transcriptional regulator, LacI family [Paenibacillus sp. UNC496MF]
MQTIAERLGVSKALVSKALSNDPAVNDVTRETIWRTAEELGYRVKAAKKVQVRDATRNLAVLLPEAYLGDFEYWGTLIQGIHQGTSQIGYNLMLTGIDIALTPQSGIPGVVKDKNVDAVIVLGHIPRDYIELLRALMLPVVLVDSNEWSPVSDHVLANNFYGAWEATTELLKDGHRHLAFVGDETSALSFSERKRGFDQAIADFQVLTGRAIDGRSIKGMGVSGWGNYISDSFAEDIHRHMTGEDPVTAMFCANDMVAIEVLRLCTAWGIACPGQISICGFDDLALARHTHPGLTTVSVPRKELGQKAVELVHRRILDPGTLLELVQLPTRYIKRESTAALSGSVQ